jgi:AraC-like DNA-binding protein
VACVWTSVSRGGTILPDGCVDVVWRGDRLIVAGPATGPMPSDVPAGTRVFGVRFRLGAAGAALGLPVSELADANVELWDGLDERVAEGGLPALLDAVRERIREPVDPLTRAAALAMGRPGARVDALELGLSERQLRRRFTDAVGYGPKTLARILRFQRFLALAADDADLAGLAFAAGYSDQAHLTRESRRLAGRTPAELLAAGAGPAGERVRFVQAAGAPGAYRPAG